MAIYQHNLKISFLNFKNKYSNLYAQKSSLIESIFGYNQGHFHLTIKFT